MTTWDTYITIPADNGVGEPVVGPAENGTFRGSVSGETAG